MAELVEEEERRLRTTAGRRACTLGRTSKIYLTYSGFLHELRCDLVSLCELRCDALYVLQNFANRSEQAKFVMFSLTNFAESNLN